MTDKQLEEYKKKGLTVWTVKDVDGGNFEVHLLRGNERFVFGDETQFENYLKEVELGVAGKAAWQPFRGNLQPIENKENGE